MPDFSRWGGNGGDPSLNAISRTDRYLDALAAEQPVYATDPADAELANLMAGWRDEVRRPPARVASQRDAEIVLHRALASRQRTRMSMAVMGSVAAALLCLGGFGAIVYSAGPGDAMYGLRVTLFGEQQVTRDDQVALAAKTEMQEVQQLIEQGNWDAAQDKLQTVTSTVQTVEDPARQEELQRQLNDLTVKVETRDPNATVPQSAPLELPPVQLPPDISLPPVQLPPNISLPPSISLPSLPPILLPKPVPDGPKPIPAEPKPAQKPDPQQPEDPKPIELPKPIEQQPKPIEQQPKSLIPDIPIPKPPPAPEAPPAQEAPPVPVIPAVPAIPAAPAPKAPPALGPAQNEPPAVEPSTTLPPVPSEKPKRGD